MLSVVCRQFSLGEIKDATKNFEMILGHGGEGIVYLGQFPAIGMVAVKCLKSNLIGFEEEIEIVSKIKHPHLISLHGYCEESGHKILVYEYMGKGSLSDYITKKCKSKISLSWQQRLNICLCAARGLQHLHTETEELPKGIIHRDIKPDNILLDHDWVAKISDFGMCKLSHAGQQQSTMITLLKGTGGYYAPEYVKYRSVTRKIDVYAFGVVLFQFLCRKMPWDRGDESYYPSEEDDLGLWARENVDPEISEEISEDCLESFTHIIGRSLQQDPSRRPTMSDVVMDLEGSLKCQQRQDEEMHPKSPTSKSSSTFPAVMTVHKHGSERIVSIPGSVRKMIQNIREMNIKEITENSDDEIYAMLKKCSMDPFQTTQKFLTKARKSNETTTELPESSNTIALYSDGDITMERKIIQAQPARDDSDQHSTEGVRRRRSLVRAIKKFGLNELEKATNGFDDKRIIVRGKFAITYEGFLHDGQTVAVKRYEVDMNICDDYRNEIMMLSKCDNTYLVSLIGRCEEFQEFIIVHEFMKNGSLADHLFGDGEVEGVPLSWEQRLSICIDAARGLEYFHRGFDNSKMIIHRSVEPANILLDEYWRAKISEFGLAKLGDGDIDKQNTSMKTDVKGSDKYLDPYYNLTGEVSRRTDVYAFGVVLFDVLLGRVDFNGHGTLGEWSQKCLEDGSIVGMVDERLKGQISTECLKEFAELASRCLRNNPRIRPTMAEIVIRLESILEICTG